VAATNMVLVVNLLLIRPTLLIFLTSHDSCNDKSLVGLYTLTVSSNLPWMMIHLQRPMLVHVRETVNQQVDECKKLHLKTDIKDIMTDLAIIEAPSKVNTSN
jgi:hypothetical protein